MPRVSGSAWPWLLADDSDAIVGVRSGNIDQLFVFSNDDALNIDMSNLAATWNASGTTFAAVKMNVTDTASAAGSLLLDLQVGGASQFRVSKGGRITAQTLTLGLGGQTAVATNTALGFEALNSASLTAINNTGVGYRALRVVATGNNNTALGAYSLIAHTIGSNNSAMGALALFSNTEGNSNNAVGMEALFANTTGQGNNAFGVGALRNNTTSLFNAAFGNNALASNTTGNASIAIGDEAAERFVASQNTAVGYRALRGGDATPANNTGVNNIAIGYQAGDAITTGSTNIVIGHDIDVDSPTGSNQINVGGVYFHDRLLYTERADPAAPAANQAVVYARDNGSGKTQLCVRFNTGAVQVISTEP
jgi:hypothetical protein